VSLYRDVGVVLRTWKLGEADRIVVLLTPEHGKVRAVAKGVRRTRSRFGARLEPTAHVALQLYAGRGELDTVTQVEAIDQFRAVREDLDRLTRAVSLLEAVDQLAMEREPNPALYRMLVGALRTLEAGDAPLVVPAFFLKLLALEGFRPVVEACAACGAEGDLVAFDLEAGGLLCREHRRGPAVSAEAVELLQAILGGRLGSVMDTPPGPASQEVARLATSTLEHHLERRLRSIGVLDRG
jgi:DNA repair protein RecO (recombination protein O)